MWLHRCRIGSLLVKASQTRSESRLSRRSRRARSTTRTRLWTWTSIKRRRKPFQIRMRSLPRTRKWRKSLSRRPRSFARSKSRVPRKRRITLMNWWICRRRARWRTSSSNRGSTLFSQVNLKTARRITWSKSRCSTWMIYWIRQRSHRESQPSSRKHLRMGKRTPSRRRSFRWASWTILTSRSSNNLSNSRRSVPSIRRASRRSRLRKSKIRKTS